MRKEKKSTEGWREGALVSCKVSLRVKGALVSNRVEPLHAAARHDVDLPSIAVHCPRWDITLGQKFMLLAGIGDGFNDRLERTGVS